ncbi:MAG: alpha/beta fold hydrolase [Gemmatimonadota bacterium]
MHRLAGMTMLAVSLALAAGSKAHAQGPEMISGGGGLDLAIYEAGNPDGPPILFIHGFSQNHLTWERQFSGPLADEFRLVALDLRGHGASDKPLDAAAYTDSALWAEDIAAVIEARAIERPVLVGWSYGGYVIADYLRSHGDDALGGIVFVGVSSRAGTEEAQADLGEELLQLMGGVFSTDVRTSIDATRAFLGLITAQPMDDETFDIALASAMMIPPEVRLALFSRQLDNDDVLASIGVPTLVVHGGGDRVVMLSSGEHIAGTVPGARLLVYEGSGHAPFFEDPDRFNQDLAEFVRAARLVPERGE